MTQPHSLTWGSLQFAGPVTPDTDYQIDAIADGTNFGNPEALIEVVRSLLTDGSLAVLQGWDNRTVPIRLRLSSPRGIAGPTLAAAESALMAEVLATSKSPLVWVPPAQDAATCVFDVVAATLTRDNGDEDDIEEVRREYRYYLLTLTCLPFARPEDMIAVPALGEPVDPGSVTVTNIDDCTTTTNWTRTATGSLSGGSFSSTGGAVVSTAVVGSTGPGNLFMHIEYTATIVMAGAPYLRVTVSRDASSPFGTNEWTIDAFRGYDSFGGYGPMTIVAVAPSAIAGCSDYYLDPTSVTAGAITAMRVYAFGTRGKALPTGTTVELAVHNLAKVDGLPVSGTTRQLPRIAEVIGSAPTQAAIRLYDATPAVLGADALVYSSRSDWAPSLRSYRVSSATVTTDSAMVSGARNTLTSAMAFEVPASALNDGTYALMARMSISTGADLTYSARMVDSSGATTIGSDVTATGTVALGVTSGYEVLSLGSLALPVVPVEGDQMIELTLTGTANMTVDEVWLFNLTDGALTWVREPSVEWIEIRSPELGAARPSVYGGTGTAGEGGVCIDFACESFGAHRFDPGLMQIFTVCSTSLLSQSEIEFYPRYHSHVDGSAA